MRPRAAVDGRRRYLELMTGLVELHELGFAHSVESFRGGRLVGGLYGIALGGCFCGESMFHLETDASKVAFVRLVERLLAWDFRLVDCQMRSEHMARFGAVEWPRDRFLDEVGRALTAPTRRELHFHYQLGPTGT